MNKIQFGIKYTFYNHSSNSQWLNEKIQKKNSFGGLILLDCDEFRNYQNITLRNIDKILLLLYILPLCPTRFPTAPFGMI